MRRTLLRIAVPAVLLGALLAPSTAAAKLSFKRADSKLPFTPQDVAIANLDGRRGPDLVIADETNGAVNVLLNKGKGTFKRPTSKPACDLAREVVVGKLNKDSSPDLLVDCGGGNYGAVSLLGKGSGRFAPARDAGIFGVQGSLGLGYINSPKGGLDVAFDGFGTNGSVLCVGTGNGNGTFSQGGYCAQDPGNLFYQPIDAGIDVADISGNAKAEVMSYATLPSGTNAAFFQWNLSDWPQSGITPYPSFRRTGAGYGRAIEAADLDRDGDTDIVTSHYDGKIGVFKWGSKGIPPSATAKLYKAGNGLDDMALGDFNGDRKLDAASISAQPIDSARPYSGTAQINLGKGNGTFATPAKRFDNGNFGGLHYLAVGDLNRDGRDDLATVEYQTRGLSILLSK